MDLRFTPSQPGSASPIQDLVEQPAATPLPDLGSLMPIITAGDPPQPNEVAHWFATEAFGAEAPLPEGHATELFRQLAQACRTLDTDRRVPVYQGLALALGGAEMAEGDLALFINELIRSAPEMLDGALADAAEGLGMALGGADMSDDALLMLAEDIEELEPTRALMADLACGLCRSIGASHGTMHGSLLRCLAGNDQPPSAGERFGFVEGMARAFGGPGIDVETFKWLVRELVPVLAGAELRDVQEMTEVLGSAVGGPEMSDAVNEAFDEVLDGIDEDDFADEGIQAARDGWLRARGAADEAQAGMAAHGEQEAANVQLPESKHESAFPAPLEKKHAPPAAGD